MKHYTISQIILPCFSDVLVASMYVPLQSGFDVIACLDHGHLFLRMFRCKFIVHVLLLKYIYLKGFIFINKCHY